MMSGQQEEEEELFSLVVVVVCQPAGWQLFLVAGVENVRPT